MWEAIIGALVTVVVGVFGVWWKNRRSVDPATQYGVEKQRNEAHTQNAKGLKAANEILDDELPKGKDLINALKEDANTRD